MIFRLKSKKNDDKIGIQKNNNCFVNESPKELYFSENDISNGESTDIAEIWLKSNSILHSRFVRPRIQI